MINRRNNVHAAGALLVIAAGCSSAPVASSDQHPEDTTAETLAETFADPRPGAVEHEGYDASDWARGRAAPDAAIGGSERPSAREKSDGARPSSTAQGPSVDSRTCELPKGPAPRITPSARDARLASIGTLHGGMCTGAFIDTSDDDEAPAFVLTAGHCAAVLRSRLEYKDYTRVTRDVSLEKTLTVTFTPVARSGKTSPIEVRAEFERIVYTTLKGRDVALIELNRTVGALKEEGLEALPLADVGPSASESIAIVGYPKDWDGGELADTGLRRAECKAGRRAEVVEDRFHWYDMYATGCTGLGPGASGAPALDAEGRVFGVYSTHYFGGLEPKMDCHLHHPCEVSKQGLAGVCSTYYVNDVAGLRNCFGQDGAFDVDLPDCPLDAGHEAEVDSLPPSIVLPPRQGEPARENVWNVSLSSASVTHYRYKVGPVHTTDCRDESGYSAARPIADGHLQHLALPQQDGFHALCIVSGTGSAAGAAWQSFQHPTVIVQKVKTHRAPLQGLEPRNISPEQVLDIGRDVIRHFRAHETAHDATFGLQYDLKMGTSLAIEPERRWTVNFGDDALVRDHSSPDVIALIACHEVGHALGGFPFKHNTRQIENFEQLGTISSSEGQADYFATKDCLPRVWANDKSVNARFRTLVGSYEKRQCDAVWSDADAQNLCYRIALAAQAFAERRAATRRQEPAKLSTPDVSEAEYTEIGLYPDHQCRLDVLFQGALCTIRAQGTAIPGLVPPLAGIVEYNPAIERAAAAHACLNGVGARPRCWFKPNQSLIDCDDFPELGECIVDDDGNSAIRTCDPKKGFTDTTCLAGTSCVIDDEGFASCERD